VPLRPAALYDFSAANDDDDDDAPSSSSSSSSSGGQGHGEATRAARADFAALRAVQRGLRDQSLAVEGVRGVAVTASLARMWRLAARAVTHNEPVLLVGETGSGKTMVCQLLAARRGQRVRILNCHQSTETADIVGGLRPVRGRGELLAQAAAAAAAALAAWETATADTGGEGEGAAGGLSEVRAALAGGSPDEGRVRAALDAMHAALAAAAAAAAAQSAAATEAPPPSSSSSASSRPSKRAKRDAAQGGGGDGVAAAAAPSPAIEAFRAALQVTPYPGSYLVSI